MSSLHDALLSYASEVTTLAASRTTTEPSYYPAIRSLLIEVLKSLDLPSDVRANTSELRGGGGRDMPDRELFNQVAEAGDLLAVLLNPLTSPVTSIRRSLGERAAGLARVRRIGGGAIRGTDLGVTISYYGAARGRWVERPHLEAELSHPTWGDTTGDLFINDEVFFGNVPAAVWRYELGGYPVLKKWLGYRHSEDRRDQPLSLAEKDYFRQLVQRIAAILSLHPRLDELYERSTTVALIK